MLNMNTDEFNNVFSVNVSAVFFCAMAFLELLDAGNKKGNVEQKSQIITTSSIGGFHRLAFAGFAYGSSKAAVTHLTKTLSTNLVPFNIRANVIAPGRKSNIHISFSVKLHCLKSFITLKYPPRTRHSGEINVLSKFGTTNMVYSISLGDGR